MSQSGFCGYTWESPDTDCEDMEHTCILQNDDEHREHECQCGESQGAEEDI